MRAHRRLRAVRRLPSQLPSGLSSLPRAAETWMADRTANGRAAELLSVLLGQFLSPGSFRAAGQPQPCLPGVRVRLPFPIRNRNNNRAPARVEGAWCSIQSKSESAYFGISSFMDRASRAAQAAFQDTWPRHEAARNRCHVSGRPPLACHSGIFCLSLGIRKPAWPLAAGCCCSTRHAAALQQQRTSSSGVRVEKCQVPNATHPRTHFPLLALFGYPSILWDCGALVRLAEPGHPRGFGFRLRGSSASPPSPCHFRHLVPSPVTPQILTQARRVRCRLLRDCSASTLDSAVLQSLQRFAQRSLPCPISVFWTGPACC